MWYWIKILSLIEPIICKKSPRLLLCAFVVTIWESWKSRAESAERIFLLLFWLFVYEVN